MIFWGSVGLLSCVMMTMCISLCRLYSVYFVSGSKWFCFIALISRCCCCRLGEAKTGTRAMNRWRRLHHRRIISWSINPATFIYNNYSNQAMISKHSKWSYQYFRICAHFISLYYRHYFHSLNGDVRFRAMLALWQCMDGGCDTGECIRLYYISAQGYFAARGEMK